MSVIVYSTPQCGQCKMTKADLERRNIAFKEINLLEDDSAMTYVRSLGYSSAPVVVSGTQHWAGYRPDLLKGL